MEQIQIVHDQASCHDQAISIQQKTKNPVFYLKNKVFKNINIGQIPTQHNQKRQQTTHLCDLTMIGRLTEQKLKKLKLKIIQGVLWVEYKWCGRKLFIASVYWPPLKNYRDDNKKITKKQQKQQQKQHKKKRKP